MDWVSVFFSVTIFSLCFRISFWISFFGFVYFFKNKTWPFCTIDFHTLNIFDLVWNLKIEPLYAPYHLVVLPCRISNTNAAFYRWVIWWRSCTHFWSMSGLPLLRKSFFSSDCKRKIKNDSKQITMNSVELISRQIISKTVNELLNEMFLDWRSFRTHCTAVIIYDRP